MSIACSSTKEKQLGPALGPWESPPQGAGSEQQAASRRALPPARLGRHALGLLQLSLQRLHRGLQLSHTPIPLTATACRCSARLSLSRLRLHQLRQLRNLGLVQRQLSGHLGGHAAARG